MQLGCLSEHSLSNAVVRLPETRQMLIVSDVPDLGFHCSGFDDRFLQLPLCTLKFTRPFCVSTGQGLATRNIGFSLLDDFAESGEFLLGFEVANELVDQSIEASQFLNWVL